MELERRALASLELSGGPHAGRVGWVSLSRRDFLAARDRAGLPGGPEHIQEVVNIPRRVAGVEVAALFYEPPGAKTTKVSLRSKGRFNVRAVAARFGGGGHQLAAGCELEKPLAATRKLVLAEIFKRLDGKVKSRGG
jgi:phosphoesterase RecJ-like protein